MRYAIYQAPESFADADVEVVDLYEDPALLAAAKEDLKRRTGGKYECPLPDYVKPPVGKY